MRSACAPRSTVKLRAPAWNALSDFTPAALSLALSKPFQEEG
jgi:hypothetical protein